MPEVFLSIKASDEASAVLQEASKNAEDFRSRVVELAKQVEQGGEAGRKAYGEMRELSRQLNASERAAKLVVDAWEDQHHVGLQTLNVLQGMSSMAGRLTNMFTQYNTLQIRINQLEEARAAATEKVTQAQEALAAAQENLTMVVAQYGPESKQAEEAAKAVEKAQRDLAKAQEEAKTAAEKLAAAQQQNTMMLVGFAMQAPSFLNMVVKMREDVMRLALDISQAGGIMNVLRGGIESVSNAMSFLAANPIMLVIAGIAAVAVVLWQLYEKCEPFRNMVNSIAEIVGGALLQAWNALSSGLRWFMDNVLMPIYNGLKWLYDVIMGIANALGLAGSKAQEAGRAAAEAAAVGAGTPVVAVPGMIPGAQAGGIVTRTGLALVHKGEPIVPAEIARVSMQPGRSVVIEKIEVKVEGVLDRDLLNQISEKLGRELKRRGVLG
ncbi:MAG: hypothetical protein QW334_00080 [Thermofilum sp.]